MDSSWTLFLDRDGVINHRLMGDYVKHLNEFELLPGVAKAIAHLNTKFVRTVVVTNQQGIGKGLMTHDDLKIIHDQLQVEVNAAGGKIDAFYYAPQLAAENSPMRKPGIGMAMAAKEQFPEIDLRKCLMVGDSPSDMVFGKNAGMQTVMVTVPEEEATDQADYWFPNLPALAAQF